MKNNLDNNLNNNLNSNLINNSNKLKILLAGTGSVASLKLPEIANKLSLFTEIKIILTKTSSFFFYKSKEYNHIEWNVFNNKNIKIYNDDYEWKEWKSIGDPILHIDLCKWADILIISPLSANTLAKIHHGICDNLLTSIVRAWDMVKPLIICPAMNTMMWNHPLTNKQINDLIENYKYDIIYPIKKNLACGDTGIGAMANVDTIIEEVKKICLHSNK